ncbi:MAG: pyruvate kinase, partial [Candidatus Saccharimonadales bacterium]
MVGVKQRKTDKLEQQRLTKVLVTIGPASSSYEQIRQFVKNGVNGFRLNLSHGTHIEKGEQIKWIRKAAAEFGSQVSIVQDLQGPKIRLGDFDGAVEVKRGQTLVLKHNANYNESGHLPTQYDLSSKVKRGERVLLFDGRVQSRVTAVKDGAVYIEVQNDGMLIKRKGMNLPDTDFGGDVITAKDRADLIWGASQDIDYVALSFVQSAEDIKQLRLILSTINFNSKIIAKIETKAAIDNLEDIIKESDVIMIARGDLAVETPAESIPVVQRNIIGLGRHYAKPTIVATQMLISMTEEMEPSRAEVSDVATAVIVGADCLMLSDETAVGRYPLEAVKTMQRIIKYTEDHTPLSITFKNDDTNQTIQDAITEAIIKLTQTVEAKAIVAETKTGATALSIASRRPTTPLIAVTNLARTAQQLAIVFGLDSYIRPATNKSAVKLTDYLREIH